jgi:hypothetical protein
VLLGHCLFLSIFLAVFAHELERGNNGECYIRVCDHFIREIELLLVSACVTADSEHERIDLGHRGLGIARVEPKTPVHESFTDQAALEDGAVLPREAAPAENRHVPISSGAVAEPTSTSAAQPVAAVVSSSCDVNNVRKSCRPFSVSRINSACFALDHHCNLATIIPPPTPVLCEAPIGAAGVVLDDASASGAMVASPGDKAEPDNGVIEATRPCCGELIGDESTTTAPKSPSELRVELIASEIQRIEAVVAVFPVEESGRQSSVEVVVEEHGIKLKSKAKALNGDDDGEPDAGVEGAELESATSIARWIKYLQHFPKGDIYRHIDSCVVPALLENGGASFLTASLLQLAFMRKRAAAVVTSRVVDWFVLLVIILSSVNLGLQEPRIDSCKVLPLSDPGNCVGLSYYLDVADVVITVTFAAEAGLQLFARGLVFSPFAYLHNGWRLLDALVVSVSIAALAGTSAGIQSLRALRALRAMRALRGLARFPHLKLVVDAMIATIPKSRLEWD